MVTSLTNPADVVVSVLTANWNSGTVATPSIHNMMDASKPTGPSLTTDGGDRIRVYNLANNQDIHGIGATHVTTTASVSIEIATTFNATRYYALINEARRILLTYRKDPDSVYDYMKIIRINDQSNKHTRLWRTVIDVELINHGEAI